MYKNYWLRRKAIREDALITYRLTYGVEALKDQPASEKRWKRIEIFSQIPQPFWIIKDDGQPCGDWTI